MREPAREVGYSLPRTASMTGVELPKTDTRRPRTVAPDADYERSRFLHDLAKASQITDELDRNPREAARTRESRRQAREGKVRWDDEGGSATE